MYENIIARQPTDKSRQQVAPSGAPGDAPPEQQIAETPLADMNPNAPPPAKPQDYVMVMEQAYKVSAEVASAIPFGEIGVASGAPPDVSLGRHATILAGGRSRMPNAPKWNVRLNPLDKWQNQLMGWTSTGDPMECCPEAALWFYTKEQAMRFCERQGWRYTLEQEQAGSIGRQKRFAGYGDNFTVKRGGVPDLTHLPSNAAAKREPGPAARQQEGRPAADGNAVTGRWPGPGPTRG